LDHPTRATLELAASIVSCERPDGLRWTHKAGLGWTADLQKGHAPSWIFLTLVSGSDWKPIKRHHQSSILLAKLAAWGVARE
jgi:hypothetical protein